MIAAWRLSRRCGPTHCPRSVAALSFAIAMVAGGPAALKASEREVQFKQSPGQIEIAVGDDPVATYFYADEEIARPYLAHVKAPGGTQVTRNHPPIVGRDDVDHGTKGNYFHPGIWLAFADINGNDYWRLKARVVHEEVVDGPTGSAGSGSFTVRNSYREQADPSRILCNELCRYTIEATADGYLIVIDSLFLPAEKPLVLGDQEEMGLAVRVATPMAVKHGGHMVNAAGRVNESQVWGQEAAWCDYEGTVDGRRVGVLLIPDPENVRASRFHARDYGLMVANPFGRKVFGAQEASRFVVAQGDSLRLRFGILLYAGSANRPFDLGQVAERIAKRMAQLPRPEARPKQ